MTSRTVLVYGRSLLLALVAAALEQEPDLTVVRTVACQEADRLLAAHAPDVLIFDLSDRIESAASPTRTPGIRSLQPTTPSQQSPHCYFLALFSIAIIASCDQSALCLVTAWS
jgi:hypothetical protein